MWVAEAWSTHWWLFNQPVHSDTLVCLGPYELHWGQFCFCICCYVGTCLPSKNPPNVTIHPSIWQTNDHHLMDHLSNFIISAIHSWALWTALYTIFWLLITCRLWWYTNGWLQFKGMAKEAEMMCSWMHKNKKPIDFDDFPIPSKMWDCNDIRRHTLV